MTSSSIQIVSPREYQIENAIFISKESVQDLDLKFKEWAEKFKYKYNELTKDDNYKRELQISVELKLKDDVRLAGTEALELFKRPEAENSLLESLTYEISVSYPPLVKVEIENSYSSRVRLSCSTLEGLDIPIDDCFYDFKDWVTNVDSTKIRKIFTFVSRWAIWLALTFSPWGLMIPDLFSQNILETEAKTLLEQGLANEEVPKAIELLLKDFAGEVVKTPPDWAKSFYIWYIASIALFLLITWFVKNFAIEIGKGKFNYKVQQFLAITMPTFLFLSVIVPIILSKF
tara:strand:+ start:397 stop:1260 length:864 start_codon:yes stop_codon:yes gene_type:complete